MGLKHNWKLLQERQKNTFHLLETPITIRVKPTNHTQYCFSCRKPINKGEKQVLIQYGVWIRFEDTDKDNCDYKKYKLKSVITSPYIGGKACYPRYIYFHANCFGCTLKRFFSQSGSNLIPNCEACPERFNCYAGNLNNLNKEIKNRLPYSPSKANEI